MSADELGSPRQAAKLRGLTAAFVVVLSAALTLAVCAVGYAAWLARDQSEQNFRMLQGIEDVNHRLIDCTEPGGKCYEEGQSRTTEAVVGINEGTLRVIVAALSCQEDGITEKEALARCTVNRAKSAP